MGIDKGNTCKELRDGERCSEVLQPVIGMLATDRSQVYACPKRLEHDAVRPRIFDEKPLLERPDFAKECNDAKLMEPRCGLAMKAYAEDNPSMLPNDASRHPITVYKGSWFSWHDRDPAHLAFRTLTQIETDHLIVTMLGLACHPDDRETLFGLVIFPEPVIHSIRIRDRYATFVEGVGGNIADDGSRWRFAEQRGGVHSDPMVRVLAYRMWGRRDIDWKWPERIESPKPKTKPVIQQLPPAPRGFRHQAGCDDPSCDGQCIERPRYTSSKEMLSKAMGALSDRSPINGPFSKGRKR